MTIPESELSRRDPPAGLGVDRGGHRTSTSGYATPTTTKRALFGAFDLRIVYDKASDRLSIGAALSEAVATMLRTGLAPLCGTSLWGWDSNPQLRR